MNNETASTLLAEILQAIDEGQQPQVVGATAISNRDAIRKAIKSLKPKAPPREHTEDDEVYYY